MQEQQIEALEISLEQAKDAINTKNELLRLQKDNQTFKRLFMDGYIERYSVSLVKQLSYPGNEGEERQKLLQDSLRAVSEFCAYMDRIIQVGVQMERDIGKIEEELDEARSEDGDLS
jgi:hypothetical protein